MARKYALVAYVDRDVYLRVKALSDESRPKRSISQVTGDLIVTALPREKQE